MCEKDGTDRCFHAFRILALELITEGGKRSRARVGTIVHPSGPQKGPFFAVIEGIPIPSCDRRFPWLEGLELARLTNSAYHKLIATFPSSLIPDSAGENPI